MPRLHSSLVFAGTLIAALATLSGCETVVTRDTKITLADPQDAPTEGTTILQSRLDRLEKLAKEYPLRSDYPYQIAGVHAQMENTREAAKALERAIALDKNESKYHYHLGRMYLRMRELDKAETAFRGAVQVTPGGRFTGAHAALGYVLCQKGDWEGARAQFETVKAIDPKEPNASYFLGCVHDARGDTAKAIENLKEYLRLGGGEYTSKASDLLLSLGVSAEEIDTLRGA